jgi:3-oxoacyl-[acyl-carrier-protein] synthase-3
MSVGIRALAVAFPELVRENSYWREHHADAVATAEGRALARLFSMKAASEDPFDIEMAPYAGDPFRGTVERRVLAPGEGSLDLEQRAAGAALAAAGVEPDAMLVASFMPDSLGAGNAAYLSRRLGLRIPAWNLESACAGAVVGIKTAAALVRAGEYERILVVVSTCYSRALEPADSLSWFMADGAGAVLVGRSPDGDGLLGSHVISTQETCDAFRFELARDAQGAPCIRMRGGSEHAGRLMRERSAEQLRACVDGALARAGVALGDIAFFVFNTPVAWFARFCARVLGVDPARTISTYERYGNVGAALTTANLYHAASEGRIRRGDLVLVYAVGSVSTAGALVLRWGDVALGPAPDR